jgi:hypothetical protein
MERQELLETESSHPLIGEPHFDEEWALLTARPVVPLEELNSRGAGFQHWNLVAAFAGAILLGGLFGLVSIRFTKPLSQTSPATEQPQTAQAETSVPAPVETPEAQSGESESVLSEVAKPTVKVVASAKRPVPHRNQTSDAETGESADEEQITTVPAAALFDQGQERRPRRVRERRLRRDRSQRDLTRIDEIFEGSHPNPEP